ncbi:hypothetical protein PRIPAC_77333 [Pristionchus pacificus]|uniref:Uncharacterized protein n=1 Tax=Pristionchus pacificus TaxID=54126 RepID=A0A2A6BID1_PRIPA|nr:hypothetical protein PRIPAC_77333 [Pristionchus pacificus]|eukprot:PDM65588.1 hypothetical protein PRIPAC_52530 [Pristionchus pacificus]
MKFFTAFVAFLLLSVILAQPPACVPTNDPPKQDDLWDLRYYYNWGRILHAFAANDEGYDKIQSNGIGYDSWNGAGSLGATISDDGFAKLAEVCGDAAQRSNIKKMWFTKTGQSYQHVFASTNPEDIYVGYVSTKADACGAKWPVKRWSCLVHDVCRESCEECVVRWETAEWRKGALLALGIRRGNERRAEKGMLILGFDANIIKMKLLSAVLAALLVSETLAVACVPQNDPPQQADLQDLRYYYNWGRILHAFSADDAGYKKMQSNGIGYDPTNGAVCGNAAERANIKKMWFTKTGQSYQHVFASTNPADIYVGYVSTKANSCGAKWPVKRWSCLTSPDMMYAGNLNKNPWYAGRQQNGGQVHFYLWEMDKATRDKQRKGC